MIGSLSVMERPKIWPASERTSIREVALIGGIRDRVTPGDSIAWAGRDYLVTALDGGDALHVRPAAATAAR